MTELARAHAFSGGLALRPFKALSTHEPIARPPLPDTLVLAMQQHAGPPAEPTVVPGETVTAGQAVGKALGRGSVAVHTPAPGIVSAIEERLAPIGTRLVATQCVIIATRADTPVPPAPTPPPWAADRARRLGIIRDGGIAGLGGAVFPTDIKLGLERTCDTLLINGAECEPYISCDDMLMRERAPGVIDGAAIMLELLGAARCIIAVERDKAASLHALQAALRARDDARFSLVSLPTVYPAGGEKQLVESLLGIEVPSGALPIEIGVVCHNVGTAYALAELVHHGRPLTSRIVTVTGHGLNAPRNVEAPIGMSIRDLLDYCGGLRSNTQQLILGGNMMGYALPTDDIPVTKATNCIIALAADEAWMPSREWPCIRCSDCATACPARLQPQELMRSIRLHQHTNLASLGLDECIECGCCDVVCPSHIPLTSLMREGKRALAGYRDHQRRATEAELRHAEHVERLAREARERSVQQSHLTTTVTADDDSRRAAIAEAVERARRRRAEKDDRSHS